jgi:2-dehydropantoate 2-reductase
MHIVMFGSGGVGAGLGCHLARNGANITFIARGAHLQAMQEHGLRVQSAKGDFTVPVQATDDPRSINDADVILLCIKTWQLESVIDDLKAIVGPNTFVVPLLNSIEAADILAAHLGASHVLGGLTYTISYLVGPGIVHSGGRHRIVFGELNNVISDRSQSLFDVLSVTGELEPENVSNIQMRMWQKFTWISSASAIGAAARVGVAQWRNVTETRDLFHTVLRESFALAQAHGVTLDEENFKEVFILLDAFPPGTKPSMQRDIEAGARSELQHQIGYVVREGQRLGVDVTVSAAVYAALLPQELAAQGK